MEKLFVSYEIALSLKEKGFDEGCIFYTNKNNDEFIYNFQCHPDEFIRWCDCDVIKAPLYQQVQDWLETKGIFIELIADGWNMEDGDINQVKSFPCYRLFIWQVGKERPKPYHDYGCGKRYQMLNIAFEEALKLI